MRRLAAVVLVAMTAAGLTAGAAQAINTASYWNTSSNPLIKKGYGSTASAYGYIKMERGSNGLRMYSYAWNKFTDADNHKAYLTGTSEYNSGSCGSFTPEVTYKGVAVGASSNCARSFYDGPNFSRADGLNYTRNTWTAFPTRSVGYNAGSDRGRGVFKLCIDIPARLDVCTGTVPSTLDSF